MNSELGGREGRQSDAVPSTIVPNAQNDGNNLRNISVQTGEEFSPDFLRDRTTASRMPFVNDVDQSPTTNRPGFNLVCEDVTDLCGLRRKDSESGTDLPDFSPSKVHAFDVDHRTHLNGAHRYYREFQPSLQHQRKFSDDYDKGNPSAPPLYSSDSPNSHQHYNKGLGIPEGSFPRKMKFLCSFGGRILPRPNDGKLRYVGGETKIISIRMSLNYAEFVRKTSAICNQPHTIKYQLPGEDLDALISVSCDEDLHHLIEEYHDLERNSQRLRIFLVTCCDNDSQCSLEDRTVQQSDADYKYVVAVNGMMDPSLHRSSSRESLASQWGAQLDSPTSFQHQEKQDGGSSLNLKLMLKSPTVQGFNVPSKSYIPSPPSSPVWFKDANNAYLKGNEDVVRPDGYDYPSPFFVEAPTYENPYRVDVKSYYHNPPIDSMPIIGSPNQKNYLFESHAVANMRSHFRKPSKEFESCSPSGANISNGRRSLLNAVPLHSKNEFVSPDTVSFSPTSDNHDKVHNREINMLSESQPQYEQFLEGREVSFSTFFGEKSPSLALSTSSQEREAQQPIADEKYQASKSKVELSQETPDLKKDYTEWGQDTIKRGEMKETFLDQDVKTDACYNNYATNTNFQEHKPNLQKIICQPDSDLRIHVPTSKQQVDGGKYSASSSDSTLNQSEVWRELPRNYQLSTNVPEFLIKSQQETINKNSHIPNEINCNSFLSEYHGLHHVGYKGNDDQSRISPFLFRDDESSFGDLSDPLVTGKISGNLGREVSGYKVLVDDSQRSTVKGSHDSGNMENIKNKSINLNVGNDTFIYSKYSDNNHKDGIPEMPVIIQDVTNDMLADVPSSSKAIPLVEEEASDGVIFPDEETEAGSSIPEFDSDDVKVDEDDKDESISDAAIIEMEAGIYGLQIIRNADLEDLHELGSGTFGTVYHGKWRGTDVAIKRIKKSCFAGRASEQERLTKDFWREAQILSKLHHPNVVAFYGVVPDGPGGTLATVTEYMANGSLRHVLLRKDRALDRRKKVIIALDAAFGMEYLHLKNIVHFDLKCDNLLVNLGDLQRPVCKVGDFGLSRIKRNTLVSGGVRGTLPWMAPELLSGISVRVSEKVDVYSFGIAMWEIITGEEPFANMHCGAIIGGIVNNTLRPRVPERCDLEWRKLMEECWSHDPAMRPSFTEITNRLRVMSAALQPKRVNRVKR